MTDGLSRVGWQEHHCPTPPRHCRCELDLGVPRAPADRCISEKGVRCRLGRRRHFPPLVQIPPLARQPPRHVRPPVSCEDREGALLLLGQPERVDRRVRQAVIEGVVLRDVEDAEGAGVAVGREVLARPFRVDDRAAFLRERVYNSDAFRVSEAGSATNRESITDLQYSLSCDHECGWS